MPARRMSQSSEIRKLFYQKIKEKVQREKERIMGHVEEELPSWALWAMKPLVSLFHDVQNFRNNSRGEDGETSAFLNLWLFLSREWVLLNDVVLEPEQDEFAQIDHILIGPPGVFLIETKAWDGAFTGYRDNWKRKQGSGWVRCSSPTKQNKRHADLFIKWLSDGIAGVLPPNPHEWVFPVVVFTRAKWLKVSECTMPVFDGATSLAWHIRRRTGERRLSAAQVDIIAEAVANAKPFTAGVSLDGSGICLNKGSDSVQAKDSKPCIPDTADKSWIAGGYVPEAGVKLGDSNARFERRKTKDGRYYVRIRGSRDEAQAVRDEVEKSGEKVGPLKSDRYERGVWYFYLG